MLVPAWGVVWPYDREARPPKPKIWVSVAPDDGLFLRINTTSSSGSVLLRQTDHAGFLTRDSWLHCWGQQSSPIARH